MNRTERDLIVMEPVFIKKVWGGRRLATDFGYDLPEGPVGECWAISAHPAGDCRVAGGTFAGMRLSELWRDHRELFGGQAGNCFPLLVKILDAREDLSVQVHPDDAYAAAHEHGSLGKRECWYVLDAEPGTDIVVGQHARSRDELARMVRERRWDELLGRVPVHAGDFFRVDPGTVHAICGGTLVLETQQSSDITYRLYDYDRPDADGRLRELHIEQSLDVVNYEYVPPVSGSVTAPEMDGVTHLMSCPDFDVDRVRTRPGAPVTVAQPWPFLCVSVVAGAGGSVAVAGAGTTHTLAKGTHFIAPACCGDLSFAGDLELIVSHVAERRTVA